MRNPLIKKLTYGFGVLIALILLTALFLLVSSLKKTPQPTKQTQQRVPKDTTTQLVKGVLPPSSELLTPLQKQTFIVTLDPALNPESVKASLAASSPSDASQKTDTPLTVSTQKNKLILTTTRPTEAFSTYTLTLTLRGQIILQQSFLSSAVSPTPLPSNNAALSQYLPHETLGYLLEYSKEENLYLVHFKYDSYSPDSFTAQLDKAKKNANEFIQSKNIDLSTVSIKYLYK